MVTAQVHEHVFIACKSMRGHICACVRVKGLLSMRGHICACVRVKGLGSMFGHICAYVCARVCV